MSDTTATPNTEETPESAPVTPQETETQEIPPTETTAEPAAAE